MTNDDIKQACDIQRDFGYCVGKRCEECEFKDAYKERGAFMTIKKLREILPNHTTVWIEDYENGDFIFANELRFADKKYDECEIVIMFPEKYPAISSFGLTLHIKKGVLM